MDRDTARTEQLSETLLNIFMIQLPANPNSQTFTGVFIDHIQDPETSSIMSSFMNKVVAPDMPRKLRFQPQTGVII
jgi:hypothetical protein